MTLKDGRYFEGTFDDAYRPYNGQWYNKDGKPGDLVKDGKMI